MSDKKCETCGDRGKIDDQGLLRGGIIAKGDCWIPCPDCAIVEDIMDFIEPEEYLKSDERIGIDHPLWQEFVEQFNFPSVAYAEEMMKYYISGYKSALSDKEKEIEELKNAIDLMIEDRDSFHNNNLKLKDLLDKAVEVLEFINEECDWEEFSGGDRRIGKVILKALTEIQEGRK